MPLFFVAAGFAAPALLEAEPGFGLAVVDRFAAVFRRDADLPAGLPAAGDAEPLPRAREPDELDAAELPSIGHLPAMTRCAASATASAIKAPSFVALDMTELAALLAVSAASMPASLMAFRALGLALIAAAAAASPAASISLLIAAFASLSTVVLPDLDDVEDFEDFVLRLVGLAIAGSPSGNRSFRHMSATTVPLRTRKGKAFLRPETASRR